MAARGSCSRSCCFACCCFDPIRSFLVSLHDCHPLDDTIQLKLFRLKRHTSKTTHFGLLGLRAGMGGKGRNTPGKKGDENGHMGYYTVHTPRAPHGFAWPLIVGPSPSSPPDASSGAGGGKKEKGGATMRGRKAQTVKTRCVVGGLLTKCTTLMGCVAPSPWCPPPSPPKLPVL